MTPSPQVGLIFGGPSGEHDVSLASAKNIGAALLDSFAHVLFLGITRRGQWKKISFQELSKTTMKNPINLETLGEPFSIEESAQAIDVAFPICHGPFGEDGQLQQFLEDLKIKYIGSGPKACERCLDKAITKEIIAPLDLAQARFLVTENRNFTFAEAQSQLALPFFVKPASMGSSVGISKVKGEADWNQALTLAFEFDCKVVVEEGIEGKEVECALLETPEGLKVSGMTEILPRHDFYSYEAKYLDPKGAQFIYPAKLDPGTEAAIRNAATKAFSALGCKDYARADFFVTSQNEIYFNEINTHPGFTSISQFPLLWKHQGISNSDLVKGLVLRRLANKGL